MTTDTLGPCPPRKFLIHSDPDTRGLHWVNYDYADWQRRRAERAEGLLRECSGLLGDSSTVKFPLPRGYIDGWRARWDELSARVAVHFDQVKP